MEINLTTIDFNPGQGGGGEAVINSLSVTSNGVYRVPQGVDGYNPVTVSVPTPEFVTETLSVSVNGTYNPGVGVDGYSQVTVNVPTPEFVTETLSVSVNGTYNPGVGVDGYSQVTVNVPEQKVEETFTVTPSTVMQTVTPTAGRVFSGGTVAAVTASIDTNILPENIKSGVEILGVEGTFEGGVTPTGTITITDNGTYNVTDYASAVVDVPQSVTGFTEKEITEGVQIVNLSNSASCVHPYVFKNNTYLQTVYLSNCTSVGEQAFALCTNLTSVYLPNCTSVGEQAFMNCNNLQNINIENCLSLSGTMFGSTKISEINLPKCREIRGGAFYNCRLLTSVSLPKCEYITGEAFKYCSVLSSIALPNCKYISGSVFNNCSVLSSVSLPNCIIIYGNCFNNCSSLSVLDLPNVMYIPSGSAFQYNSFTSVSLPNCRVISGIAFQYCHSLSEELNLPACGNIGGAIVNDTNVTKANVPMVISFNTWYGNPVFVTSNFSELHLCIDVYGCPSYSNVIGSITKLHSGEGSIYVNEQNYSYFISASGWSNISSIIYSVSGDSYPLISGSDGLLYGSTKAVAIDYSIYTNLNSANLTSVSLPNCEYIDAYTFRSCRSLTSVSLPNCEFIGASAFEGCSNITGFSLPNCKFIDNNAFKSCSCSTFTSLTLPNCKYIRGGAFENCKFVSEIYFPGSEVCFIEQTTMWNTGLVGNTLKFYVPASLIDEYKSALWWSSMTDRIFPIE